MPRLAPLLGPAPALDQSHPSYAGLVAYYGFGEGAGSTVSDLSGGGSSGTWQGTLGSQWTQGPTGRAGLCNGTDGCVLIGQPARLQNLVGTISVQAWVRPSVLPGASNFGIVTKDAQSTLRCWNLMLGATSVNNHFRFGAVGATSGIKFGESASAPTVGLWYHLVGVWDGALVTLWVNGVRQPTTAALTDTALATAASNVFIGRIMTVTGTFFSGAVDEVAIWSRALAPAEIARLYVERAGLYRPRRLPQGIMVYSGPTPPAQLTQNRAWTVGVATRATIASQARTGLLSTRFVQPVAIPLGTRTALTATATRSLDMGTFGSSSALGAAPFTVLRVGGAALWTRTRLAMQAYVTPRPGPAAIGTTVQAAPAGMTVHVTITRST